MPSPINAMEGDNDIGLSPFGTFWSVFLFVNKYNQSDGRGQAMQRQTSALAYRHLQFPWLPIVKSSQPILSIQEPPHDPPCH
jgi:hypothetical protein